MASIYILKKIKLLFVVSSIFTTGTFTQLAYSASDHNGHFINISIIWSGTFLATLTEYLSQFGVSEEQ